MTESIPEYGSGWDVFVETTGRIDRKYEYLFYEASIHDLPSFNTGWCFYNEDLPVELRTILLEIGLNDKEADDFLEYWLEYLAEYEYYSVYPVFNRSLDQYVELHVTPEPDAQLRFWLFFEGSTDFRALPDQAVPAFQRGSTTVVEWGGTLLN